MNIGQVAKFMKIEEPEEPPNFPVQNTLLAAVTPYRTIGQFYLALIEKIKEFGDSIFTGEQIRS